MKFSFYPRFTFSILLLSICFSVLAQTNQVPFTGGLPAHNTYPVIAPPQLPSTITMSAPSVINFSQLAAYQQAHPFRGKKKKRLEEQGEDIDQNFHYIPKPLPFYGPKTYMPTPRQNPSRATSPAPLGTWAGVPGDGSLIPPDIRGAAGTTYVMETTNQDFRIYTKTGTLTSTLNITTFFNDNTNTLFDPHILYDFNYDRFVVIIDVTSNSQTNSKFHVAVSQTGDPTGNWYVYTFSASSTAADFVDFPLLGLNTNWVVITGNNFVSGGNTQSEIYVLNRVSLYSGTLGTVSHFTDANQFTIGPAHTIGTSTTTEWLVSDNDGANGYMQVGSITGTAAAPVYNAGTTVGVTQLWSETAVAAPQSGNNNTIEAGDTRMSNVVYSNGSLWFTHGVFLPAGNNPTRASVDWWQVNPTTLAVQQFGRLDDATGANFYTYPSITVDGSGNALLGYCKLSSTTYASACYSFHAATDAAGTMQGTYTYKAGVAGYYQTLGGGRNRWGDYTSTALDPSDNSFWGFGEWANTNNIWATQVVHVPGAAPLTNPPTAAFTADVTSTCIGIVNFTDESTGAPTSWLWNFGDGTTSTLQNPSHDYITNGTFTVTLKATNQYGNNTATQTAYITVNKPTWPTASAVQRCGAGTVSLSATTTDTVSWYDANGTLVSNANPYTTPSLSASTTYYVESSVASTIEHVGPVDTTIGAGGYFTTANSTRANRFTVQQNSVLVSVVLYSSTAGGRTIQLRDSSGGVITSKRVVLPVGKSTVTLNFNLTPGGPYELGLLDTTNLYRNTAGANFPYTDAQGLITITGNNITNPANPGYYYFFYDWNVRKPNCTSLRTTVPITINPAVSVTATATNVACGASTGSATATPTGGTGAITYAWSNAGTAATINNIAPNTYTVTVTDTKGCTATASATVSSTGGGGLSVTTSAVPTRCHGSSNGSATVTPTNGTAPYTYNWSNGTTTGTASNLAAGTYTVTVNSNNGCSSTSTVTVTDAPSITATATASPASCGLVNGSVAVAATGGTGTYTYHWSNNSTATNITGLNTGTYNVTVTDGNSCTAAASGTVVANGSLGVTNTTTNVSCNGGSNGSITVTANGTAPYTYHWSNNITGATVTGLSAGTYTVSASDANGCSSVSSITVTAPTAVSVSLTPTSATCGQANGSINSQATGGTGAYTYHWSNNATTATITNIASGGYTVTVSDANSCTSSSTTTVGSAAVSINVTANISNASCAGVNNGSIIASASGGTPNYFYNWSNNLTGSTIASLAPGNYAVTVTDANTCSTVASFIVSPAATLQTLTTSQNVSCLGGVNGSGRVKIVGGTPGYNVTWSNGVHDTLVTGLIAGSYYLTVTDANGCTTRDSITVSEPATGVSATTSTTPTLQGQSTGSAGVAPAGGTPSYTVSWSNGGSTDTITGLAAGSYTATVTDANGCTTNANVTVLSTVGIGGVNTNIDAEIFPNPTAGNINITLHLGDNCCKTRIIMRDILGQTLVDRELDAAKDLNTSISMDEYANGVYTIEIQNGENRLTKKVILKR